MNINTVQNNLVELGYGSYLRPYGIDGKDGTKTRNGVKAFQKDYNKKFNKKIKVDSIAGVETKKAFDHWLSEIGKVGSRNFKISEFNCKGTGKMLRGGMDNQLIRKLERLRYVLGDNAITITSGYRTSTHNKAVGGVSNSQHLYGKAADIKVKNVSASRVYQQADRFFNGVGKYNSFTHVDTRGYKARF